MPPGGPCAGGSSAPADPSDPRLAAPKLCCGVARCCAASGGGIWAGPRGKCAALDGGADSTSAGGAEPAPPAAAAAAAPAPPRACGSRVSSEMVVRLNLMGTGRTTCPDRAGWPPPAARPSPAPPAPSAGTGEAEGRRAALGRGESPLSLSEVNASATSATSFSSARWLCPASSASPRCRWTQAVKAGGSCAWPAPPPPSSISASAGGLEVPQLPLPLLLPPLPLPLVSVALA